MKVPWYHQLTDSWWWAWSKVLQNHHSTNWQVVPKCQGAI